MGGHPPKEWWASPERAICLCYKRYAEPSRAGLASARLRRLALAAAELEPAARALPGAVAPLHRGAAAQTPLDGRLRCGSPVHSAKRRNGPGQGPRGNATGAHVGRPGNVVLENPDEEQDDDDEREKSATDVHSGLLYAVDVGTTPALLGRLRRNPLATMRPRRRRGRVVRQRPAKPRTAVRFCSAPSSLDVEDEVERGEAATLDEPPALDETLVVKIPSLLLRATPGKKSCVVSTGSCGACTLTWMCFVRPGYRPGTTVRSEYWPFAFVNWWPRKR